MSRKTEEEYKLYNNYLSRNADTGIPSQGDSSNRVDGLAGFDNVKPGYDSKSVSTGLNDIEMRLLEAFPNLSTIADVIEDTIIVVDGTGIELPDNLETRKAILERLLNGFEKDNKLFAKIREVYPSFGLDIISKLSPDEYATYMSEVSKMKKLCGTVNSVSVIKDDDDGGATHSAMLEDIAECIDTASFQEASLIEKRFIKGEIAAFRAVLAQREEAAALEDEVNPRYRLLQTITEIDELEDRNRKSLELLEKYSSYFSKSNLKFDRIPETKLDNEEYR